MTRTLLDPPLREAEQFTKPGTANVDPSDLKKLGPLIKHFAAQAKPFTACVRAQVKHGLSMDHARRRCAVLADLGMKPPGWRSREEDEAAGGLVASAALLLATPARRSAALRQNA